MMPWWERPREEAHLLNPAFGATIITAAARGYQDEKEEGLPFVLSFLILPIVLHKLTRDALPSSIRTSIPAWLQRNPEARVLFAERVVSLRPHTREAILFGANYGWIRLAQNGRLEAT